MQTMKSADNKVTMRNYRTYLLNKLFRQINIDDREAKSKEIEEVKSMTTQQLKERFDNDKSINK